MALLKHFRLPASDWMNQSALPNLPLQKTYANRVQFHAQPWLPAFTCKDWSSETLLMLDSVDAKAHLFLPRYSIITWKVQATAQNLNLQTLNRPCEPKLSGHAGCLSYSRITTQSWGSYHWPLAALPTPAATPGHSGTQSKKMAVSDNSSPCPLICSNSKMFLDTGILRSYCMDYIIRKF